MSYLSSMPLRHLSLGRLETTAKDMAALGDLPLEQLSLDWSSSAIKDLAWLSCLIRLHSLSISQSGVGSTLLKAVSHLQLRKLDISDAGIDEADLDFLAEMPLESLNLNGGRYLDSLADTLEQLRELPLKHLGMSDLACFSNAELAALDGFSLESLDLSVNPVNHKCLKHLRSLAGLRRLSLSGVESMSGKAIQAIVDCCPGLQFLDIGINDLRDKDLELLNKLPLRELSLYESPWLTDKGVRSLQGMPLRSLTISAGPGESQITDASVSVLEELPLEELCLWNCDGISEDGWSRLAKLPARVVGPGI